MSSTLDNSCKESASKSNNDLSDAIGYLRLLNIKDNNATVGNICANCGKEGDDNMNTCNKCKQVRYCNAVCKKVHKKKHKKQCEEHQRLATEKHNEELRIAAELHDEELFKQPPPDEDCPICFIRLPALDTTGRRYMSCCGKTICSGCFHAPVYDNQGNKVKKVCPFCRIPHQKSDKEMFERTMKRMEEVNDAIAIYNMGCWYRGGMYGLPQDNVKALELWHRGAELGFTHAYTNIGFAYSNGMVVEVDQKKALYYWELAAIGGDVYSRHNLGNEEALAGNMDRALKHQMIAVRDGYTGSLNKIKELYSNGSATKEDYMEALRSYQAYLKEIKSDQRDEAAAADAEYRYH